MRTLRTSLVLSLLLFFAQFALAGMYTGYSSYTNTSMGGQVGNNLTLYVTAVVDGSAGFYFPQAFHTGQVVLTVNGSTTTSTGNPTPPNAYLYVSASRTIVNCIPGFDYGVEGDQTIRCNFGGLFFDTGFSFSVGISISNMQWNGAPPIGGVTCVFDISCPLPGPEFGTCKLTEYDEVAVTQIPKCPADGLEFRWIHQPYVKENGSLYCAPFGTKTHSATYTQCH